MNPNPINLPSFGTLIPGQGGYFAAIVRAPQIDGAEQPPAALIVSDISHEFTSPWGEYGQDVAGAHSRTDSKGNTEAMADAGCAPALRVRALDIEGHSDWIVPSLGDMNSAAANVPELFDPKGVYWTSTQYSAHSAFVQGFEDGDSGWSLKDRRWQVRPFRRIPLHALTA
jgi:hypothetical protein